jgi:flagellar L-ring protein precursor FlgH
MRSKILIAASLSALLGGTALAEKKKDQPQMSALDEYIAAAGARSAPVPPASAGSLWSPGAPLGSLGSDLRASRVDDIVTIIVAESASAVSRGTVKTQRTSAARSSINSLAKKLPPGGALPNLLDLSSAASLDGEGATSRQTQLATLMSARVTHVLPNGNLVVEGSKIVRVNSEQQVVVVRGVVRPVDLSADNAVESARLAQMEITVNGKGVVGDAIRRPFILYRLLLGLLPF